MAAEAALTSLRCNNCIGVLGILLTHCCFIFNRKAITIWCYFCQHFYGHFVLVCKRLIISLYKKCQNNWMIIDTIGRLEDDKTAWHYWLSSIAISRWLNFTPEHSPNPSRLRVSCEAHDHEAKMMDNWWSLAHSGLDR